MKQLISFSVRHPVSILMFVLSFVLLGVLCMLIVSADFLPVIQSRELLVATEYEGIAAREIRSMISIPMEDAFASLKGLKTVTSVSRDGLSLLKLELHWGTDIDMTLIESREIIDICFETLPSGCKKPVVRQMFNSGKETVTIAVIPLDADLQYGRYITDNDIKPRIQRLNGVASVSVSGGEKEQIHLRVYRDKMEARKLTLQSISESVSVSNFEYPAGTIKEGEKELLVKTSGQYSNIDEIAQTPLAYNEGGILRLGDIAEVVRGIEKKQSFFLYEGNECIRLGLTKKNDASPLVVSREIKKELAILEQVYGKYYSFKIIEDLSVQIIDSLFSLLISVIAGIVVTAVVIFCFLKSWQVSLLLSSVIPITAVVSVFILGCTGKTVNMMSLSGMAIGIGMVVDCSAIVLENIQKQLTLQESDSYKQIIIEGTHAVALSATGSTATTIIVFIPVFFIKGLLGELFEDMALTIIASILMSFILSLTYIPAVFTLISPHLPVTDKKTPVINKLEVTYEKAIRYFFKKKYVTILLTLTILAIGIVSSFCVPRELLPRVASKTITAQIVFPQGTTTAVLQQMAKIIHERVKREPYITSVHISGGIEPDEYEALIEPGAQKEKLLLVLDITTSAALAGKKLEALFTGSHYAVQIAAQADILSELLAMQTDSFVLQADSVESASTHAKRYVSDEKRIVPNFFVQEWSFVPDRVAAARFSVSALYTATLARNSLEGVLSLPFYENGREIPVLVKLQDSNIRSVSDFENMGVQLEETVIPLRLLGSIQQVTNEKVLYRYNRKDAKILRSPFEKNLTETETKELISLKDIEFRQMLGDSVFLLIVIIFLLYLIMGAQFESFSIPLFLMLSLPPAFSGAFLFLAVFGKTLNINSIIALVVLFGTSVNNAILLYEKCITAVTITAETIIQSCKAKLRAVLITSGTTICALLPFAVDINNTHAQSSLSIAIIGGLLFSLVLVLLVIPVIFSFTLPGRRKENE